MVFGSIVGVEANTIQPIKTEVTGNIIHSFASLKYKETFFNNSAQVKNFTFVIDNNSEFIVYNVKAKIGNEMIEFVVREKEESKQSFQESSYEGYSSGYAEKSSDSLSFNIANVPAKQEFAIFIEASLVGKVNEANSILFDLPHENTNTNEIVSYNIKIQNEVKKVVFGEKDYNLVDKSFVYSGQKDHKKIIIEQNSPIDNKAIGAKIGNNTYLGLSMIPNIESKEKTSCEYYFVIDCSGSMYGNPIQVAKNTLKCILKSIPYGSYFNIVRFGSTFEGMFDNSVEYNRTNYEKAINMADFMAADLGGTRLYDPLVDIYNRPVRKNCVRQIFVLTDGETEYKEQIIHLVEKNRANSRVFTFGIGSSIDPIFINDSAKYSCGLPFFINSSNDITSTVMKALAQSATHALTDVQIHIEGNESITVSPFPIPPIFSGNLSHIFVEIVGDLPEHILVTGKSGKEECLITVDVERCEGVDLEKLFGYFVIKDSEKNFVDASVGEQPKLQQMAVQQSIKYGIPSQFTAIWGQGQQQRSNIRNQRNRILQQQNMNAYSIPVQPQGVWCQSQQQYFDQRPPQQCFEQRPRQQHYVYQHDPLSEQRRQIILQNAALLQQNLEAALCRGESYVSSSQQMAQQAARFACGPCFGQSPPQFVQSQPTISANDFLSIASRQDFDGFWDCYSELRAASGFKSTLTNKNDKINSTILALAMIMKNFAQNPEMWRLIKEKAITWLKSQDSSKDWEQEIANCIKNLP